MRATRLAAWCVPALLGAALFASEVAAQSTSLAGAAREVFRRPVIGQSAPAGQAGAPERIVPARFDYLLHCSGCHGEDGTSSRLGRIPPLKGTVGHFLHLPEGRNFLVQVPGVHNAGLDDARVAGVMNWMIPRFAGASLPVDGFAPYSTAEVARARASRPADIPTYRRELALRLARIGHPIDY